MEVRVCHNCVYSTEIEYLEPRPVVAYLTYARWKMGGDGISTSANVWLV